MSSGLDTSVVVRLLVGAPTAQAEVARQAIENAARGSVAVSDLVIGESYFALRHHYEVPHHKAIAALTALVSDPRIRCTGVAAQVLARAPDRETNPGFMDRLIHGGYESDGITLLTFDRAAARLPSAQLLG
jgi:Predicted nucleic-acid-binding protein, contains PIN domain